MQNTMTSFVVCILKFFEYQVYSLFVWTRHEIKISLFQVFLHCCIAILALLRWFGFLTLMRCSSHIIVSLLALFALLPLLFSVYYFTFLTLLPMFFLHCYHVFFALLSLLFLCYYLTLLALLPLLFSLCYFILLELLPLLFLCYYLVLFTLLPLFFLRCCFVLLTLLPLFFLHYYLVLLTLSLLALLSIFKYLLAQLLRLLFSRCYYSCFPCWYSTSPPMCKLELGHEVFEHQR